MSSNDTFGAITKPRCQTYVEWKIPNYLAFCQRADTFIDSPPHHFLNASWCFRIFPNGQRSNRSVEWISLFLVKLTLGGRDVPLNYTMGIKCFDGDVYHQESSIHRGGVSGFPTFIERTELLQKRKEIFSGSTLTIFCVMENLKCVNDVASQTVSLCDSNALSRDFQSLFQSEQNSDVTFQVNGQKFRAHKLILRARSSVFAAMFEHNMKENSTGVVNIADCDPSDFHDFLLFIYTGKIEVLSSENVSQLFMLSDKYDLSDLGEMCMDFMKENLSLDVVCDVATIAYKYDKEDLKATAKELIINNIKTLLPTQQWITFMKDNSVLAAELLMTSMSVSKS